MEPLVYTPPGSSGRRFVFRVDLTCYNQSGKVVRPHMSSELLHKQIFELIGKSQQILLLTDERIDGDTTGSSLAMFHFLKGLGKDVHLFSPKAWPIEYHFLPGYDGVQFDPAVFDQPFDLAMIFDCADGQYIQAYRPKFAATPLVVFDHHATNPQYGTINQIIVDASSTGEVVWRCFKANGAAISKDMATCLMTAICTDTTLFTNPATNQVCMEAAAELGLAGAKVQDVVKAIYMNKSVETLKAWGLVLERLQELPGGIVVSFLLQKDKEATGVTDVDTSAISNFLGGMVGGADIIAIFSEKDDGSVKASLRALNGDVAAIAQRYGGGGHVKAAGFGIPNARLDQGPYGWRVLKTDGSYLPIAELLS